MVKGQSMGNGLWTMDNGQRGGSNFFVVVVWFACLLVCLVHPLLHIGLQYPSHPIHPMQYNLISVIVLHSFVRLFTSSLTRFTLNEARVVVVGVDVDVDDDEAVDADPVVWEGMESGAGAIAMPVGLSVV